MMHNVQESMVVDILFFGPPHILHDFLYHTYVGTSSVHLFDNGRSVLPELIFAISLPEMDFIKNPFGTGLVYA